MRFHEIVTEAPKALKPAQFREFRQADRATVAKAKPSLCADGWEIVVPGYFATQWGAAALNEKPQKTWEWCVRAIAALRAEMGMPPKTFPRPAEKSQEGFIATSPKTLYHGTNVTAASAIAHQGLVPQVGAFVKGSHGGKDHVDLIFAGSARDFHRVVAAMYVAGKHIQTDADFFEMTALITMDNDGKWFQQKAGYESPKSVEAGDYYRFEPIRAKTILVGDELRAFFETKVGRMPSDFIDMIEPN